MSEKDVQIKSISTSGLHPVILESTPAQEAAGTAARDRELMEASYSSLQFISDAAAFANMDEASYESVSTSAILRYCKMKVLKPYFRLLSILGWRPLISQNTLFENACWARLINCTYVILILSLIMTGYVLQYSSCYRQDGYRPYADIVKPADAQASDHNNESSNRRHDATNGATLCRRTYHSLVQADGLHASDVRHVLANISMRQMNYDTPTTILNDSIIPPKQRDLLTRVVGAVIGGRTSGNGKDMVDGEGSKLTTDNKRDLVTAALPNSVSHSESEDKSNDGELLEGHDKAVTPGTTLTPYGLNAVPNDLICTPKCRGNFFALYLVPNLLHLLAYLCVWYLMRTPESEKLENLMERGFLQTTRTTGWMMAHKKLVSSLRRIIWMCLAWLLLSALIHGLIVGSRIQDLNLTWLKYGEPIKSLLIALTLASLTFNDLICGAIVTSYTVHCQLNISYIFNLCASIREKRIEFQEFYKRIEEARKFIDYLNDEQALGLSLLLITVGCKLSAGVYALLASGEFNLWSPYAIAIVLLSLLFWSSLFAVPIVQAIRLTAACTDLRKIGHEIRARPFGYQDTDQSDLDSLLLYTTNLSMEARILRVPVTSSCTLIIVIVFLIVILMFGQLGLLNV